MLSDADILKLYTDETWHGSYGSARTLQMMLKTDFNEDVKLARIYKILQQQPFYIYQVKPLKNFPTRSYDVKAFNEQWQSDLAFLPPKDGYIGFLLCTDLFSNRIWTVLLKNKEAATVQKGFETIFAQAGQPDQLSTDQGKEYVGIKNWLKSKHIRLTFKYQANKANFAEFGIYLVKSRLFRLLRHKVTDDWPKYIPYIVKALNERPLEKLGNLRPIDVKSPLDDIKVQQAQKTAGVEPFSEPDWNVQIENQKKYEKSPKNLQVGNFVYKDDPQRVFRKSFHVQVYTLFSFYY